MARGIGRVEGKGRSGPAARVVGAAEEFAAQVFPIRLVRERPRGAGDDGVQVVGRRLPAGPDVIGVARRIMRPPIGPVRPVGEESVLIPDDVFELGLCQVLAGAKICI